MRDRSPFRVARVAGGAIGCCSAALPVAAGAQAGPAAAAVAEGAHGTSWSPQQRRSGERIGKVPISIASYSRELMDREGVRGIEDHRAAHAQPPLRTQTTGVTGNNGSNIQIRGVASDVGSVDHRDLHRRHAHPDPQRRLFRRQPLSARVRPRARRGAARPAGHAVRRGRGRRRASLHHAAARLRRAARLRAQPKACRDRARRRTASEGGLAIGGPVGATLALRASGWLRQDGGYRRSGSIAADR